VTGLTERTPFGDKTVRWGDVTVLQYTTGGETYQRLAPSATNTASASVSWLGIAGIRRPDIRHNPQAPAGDVKCQAGPGKSEQNALVDTSSVSV